ncbi:hypothetical protein H0H92_013389 [Tricholoma furcatifolium]|nr:hypothetical protein H0H92_013389 [Tricholoma furcatifolium]
MAGETIMGLTYGLKTLEKDDPYVEAAAKDWMPFAGFKKKAKEWRKYALDMVNLPFDALKRNIENGDRTTSFAFRSLERMDETGNLSMEECIIKSTAGSLYAGELEMLAVYTVSAIASCILGLLSNPEAFQKGQREIDRVVGTKRLPTFEDLESLLYITAITKEALRWRSVTPLAGPRLLHEEDVFNGYRMPKGSIVIANAWSVLLTMLRIIWAECGLNRAILHDENIYPLPLSFNPDRFIKDGKLDPNVRDPMHAAFGFGRRICPARYMAFSAVWIAIATLIATFDISKARDDDGNVIEPRDQCLSALTW